MKASRKNALKLMVITVVAGLFVVFGLLDARTRADAREAPPISASSSAGRAQQPASLFNMSPEEAERRSAGCLDCHAGIEDMHNGKITIGCIDCHGGNAEARLPQGAAPGSAPYDAAKKQVLRYRLSKAELSEPFRDFAPIWTSRVQEADAYYAELQADMPSADGTP